MVLDISHNAWHGAYSAFSRFRQMLCAVAGGGSFPPHSEEWKAQFDGVVRDDWWYWGDGYSAETHPGLAVFFLHSDCDGDIHWRTCGELADELTQLLPAIEAFEKEHGLGGGHIQGQGGYVQATKKLIAGCREAFQRHEDLEFR